MTPYSHCPPPLDLAFQSQGRRHPSVVNTRVDGVDAYATSDLFEPHPDAAKRARGRGLWRLIGRVDDQIMHSTGEKVRSFASCGR